MKITIKALQEEETPEQSEKATGSAPGYAKAVRKQMEVAEGRWGWCIVKVTVRFGNKKGVAYLGNCSYLSATDFIKTSMYFPGLVKEAIEEVQLQSIAQKAG